MKSKVGLVILLTSFILVRCGSTENVSNRETPVALGGQDSFTFERTATQEVNKTAEGSTDPGQLGTPTFAYPSEIVYTGLGGGDAPCLFDNESNLGGEAVFMGIPRLGIICIWGMPTGETIRLSLISPERKYTLSGVFSVERSSEGNLYLEWRDPPIKSHSSSQAIEMSNGSSAIWINLWWPIGLTTGAWTGVAESNSARVEGVFNVPEYYQPEIGVAYDLKDHGLQLVASDGFFCNYLYTYNYGDSIPIIGRSFSPNSKIPIGIYQGARSDNKFSEGLVATTNDDGFFSTSVTLDYDLPGTIYSLYAIIDRYEDSNPKAPDECFQMPQ